MPEKLGKSVKLYYSKSWSSIMLIYLERLFRRVGERTHTARVPTRVNRERVLIAVLSKKIQEAKERMLLYFAVI